MLIATLDFRLLGLGYFNFDVKNNMMIKKVCTTTNKLPNLRANIIGVREFFVTTKLLLFYAKNRKLKRESHFELK